MMSQNPMTKLPQSGAPTDSVKQIERRASRRCKITQLMRLRPSDPEIDHFDDLRGTLSLSRTGVYFQTTEAGYEVGMRLFMTMPYSLHATDMNREYLTEVVRKEVLTNGMTGIGCKILMEMGLQQPFSYGFSGTRR